MVSSTKRRRLEDLNQTRTKAYDIFLEAMKIKMGLQATLTQQREKLLDPTGAETSQSSQELKTLISELKAEISEYEVHVSALRADVARLDSKISETEADLIETSPVSDEDYFEQIRKLPAPSSLQKASSWRRAQEKCVYLCHCPPDAEPPLPLTLVHPAFANFVDSFNNTTTVEFGGDECQLALDLCLEVGKDHFHEVEKADVINHLIGKYLGLHISPIIGKACLTDGSHVQGEHLIYTSECKKEEGNSLFQGIHYYGLFLAGKEPSLRESTVCPCFLVELVGVHMRISGLAYLNKVACQPFTTFMHCYTNTYDKTDLDCLCRAFWALKRGLSELKGFYGSSRPPRVDKRMPYPLQAQPVGFFDRIGTKLLFVVKVGQSKDLKLVKYCKRYGDNVHATWADNGLAPKLLACDKIAGGWVSVEMEYLSGPDWKTVHEWAEQLDESKKSELQSAVDQALKVAHGCTCEGVKVAHGDLRAPNIMARSVEDSFAIRFLDFDWAGAVQSTVYPSFVNTRLPWHKDVGTGKPLQQDHDRWWADKWTEAEAEDT